MSASALSGKTPRGAAGRRGLALGLYVAAALAAIAAVLVIPLSAYSLNLLMQAATYAIAVLGLTIVLGYTGQINLAQAAFFGLGAYSVALGTTAFALPFWIALAIGVLIAAGAGAVLGLTSLRLGGHYLAMVTISFQTILTLVLTNWVAFTRGPDGVPNIRRPVLLAESGPYLGLCIAALFAVAWFVWRLKTTKLGRAMQAVRDNELAANVVGVDAYATKVAAFTLSALLGGFGGALFAGGFAYVSPDQFSFAESVVFLTMVLLGGAAAPPGAVLGTGLLILLPEWLRFLKVIYLAVYGGAVILIMVFMPDGIWGYAMTLWHKLRPERPFDPGFIAPLALTRETAREDGSVILSVHGLSKHFGGLKAVDEIDLTICRNTVHALIGPNGSGKTTLLNALNGIVRPTGGIIKLEGVDVTRLPPHRRAGLGLGRTFQNIRLFGAMSVLDNVMVGAEQPHPLPTLPRERGRVNRNTLPRLRGRVGKGAGGLERHALAALDFVGIAARAGARVGSLSYGHQRLVEIARALAGRPKLLFLDEPGAGLNHVEKDELVRLLNRLKGHGLTIFIIDHDMAMVEQVADHITVLNFGKRIADGTPSEVLRHPEVIVAYLGEERPALSRSHGAS
ncbi:MAG TPA: branched-chain amino acid ABC transporter ATP-binding protein/permease [Xanthobacteraceae bacterium]|nr:branched-chain amino acid ABC transporter ATP-binding protein/permease [Xanthobacteraceae bacterium]